MRYRLLRRFVPLVSAAMTLHARAMMRLPNRELPCRKRCNTSWPESGALSAVIEMANAGPGLEIPMPGPLPGR